MTVYKHEENPDREWIDCTERDGTSVPGQWVTHSRAGQYPDEFTRDGYLYIFRGRGPYRAEYMRYPARNR